MVELGNFKKYTTVQNRSEIKWETFTDAYTLTNPQLKKTNTIRIFESHNFPNYNEPWSIYRFNWSPKYITDRFKLAIKYKNFTDYMIFLLQEEIYLPSQCAPPSFQKIPNDYKNYDSYQIAEANNMWIHTKKGEIHFFNDLLRAWHKMCYDIGKKTAVCGCPLVTHYDTKKIFETLYGVDNLKYIAKEYDMVYLYRYPTKGNATKSGHKAKEFIDYWRKTLSYKRKINYIVDTYFNSGSGTTDESTIKADFCNAASSGAHIISAYPFKKYTDNDTSAVSRSIQIHKDYNSHKNGYCSNGY